MSKKKLEPDIKYVVSGQWMMTFSDLLTLLLAFFVLLLTMSAMDQRKFEDAFGMFAGAFGSLAKQSEAGTAPDFIVPITAPVPEILVSDIEDVLERSLREQQAKGIEAPDMPSEPAAYQHLFEVEAVDDGIEVRIAAEMLFVDDTDKLKPSSSQMLREVASDVVRTGIPARVKAYVPPRGFAQDAAWALALDRASRVVGEVLQTPGVRPRLLSLMGYGRVAPRTLRIDKTRSLVVITFFNRLPIDAQDVIEEEDDAPDRPIWLQKPQVEESPKRTVELPTTGNEKAAKAGPNTEQPKTEAPGAIKEN
ncbi:MAG: chemotaxis protein MotB [Myxococcota bacterium]|jgi:chemotaxis protein MotB